MNIIPFPRSVAREPGPDEALTALCEVALALQNACDAIGKGPGSDVDKIRAINELHCGLIGVARVIEIYRPPSSKTEVRKANDQDGLVSRLTRGWSWLQR
jgi:hypothetical protein